jgi:hypothetical protein
MPTPTDRERGKQLKKAYSRIITALCEIECTPTISLDGAWLKSIFSIAPDYDDEATEQLIRESGDYFTDLTAVFADCALTYEHEEGRLILVTAKCPSCDKFLHPREPRAFSKSNYCSQMCYEDSIEY